MNIYAIQTGFVQIKTRQKSGEGQGIFRLLNTILDSEWTAWLPIYAWVIEHPEGLIVVDTGETARTVTDPNYLPKWHLYHRYAVHMDVKPEDEIGPQMRLIGFNPDDVRWVVMTHLHTDHAGGIPHFPKAEFLVTRREYEVASGLSGRLQGYLNQHYPDWFAPTLIDFPDSSFATFDRHFTLTPEITLVPTPGHTPGHMSVVIQEDEKDIFIAGDTSYTESLMREQVIDGVSPDTGIAADTLDRILRYAHQKPLVYLPSHDPESAARLAARQTVFAEELAAV